MRSNIWEFIIWRELFTYNLWDIIACQSVTHSSWLDSSFIYTVQSAFFVLFGCQIKRFHTEIIPSFTQGRIWEPKSWIWKQTSVETHYYYLYLFCFSTIKKKRHYRARIFSLHNCMWHPLFPLVFNWFPTRFALFFNW